MTRIKYDMDIMKYMSLFSFITRVSPKDCIVDESGIFFIVPEGTIGKAIGKQGANVKKLSLKLNKKVSMIEFSPNVLQFAANIIYPLKPTDVIQDGSILTIKCADTKTRGLLIGRSRSHLNFVESVVNRFFDISEIKVE